MHEQTERRPSCEQFITFGYLIVGIAEERPSKVLSRLTQAKVKFENALTGSAAELSASTEAPACNSWPGCQPPGAAKCFRVQAAAFSLKLPWRWSKRLRPQQARFSRSPKILGINFLTKSACQCQRANPTVVIVASLNSRADVAQLASQWVIDRVVRRFAERVHTPDCRACLQGPAS